MMRKLLATGTVILWLVLVLAWSSGISFNEPWHATRDRQLAGEQLGNIAGDSRKTADGLQVSGLGQYRQGLQSWQLDTPLDARQMPILRYRMRGFPRSLELALIFRTDEDADDVHSATLPWPRDGVATIDLSALPDWRGQITEIGFSEYPMPAQAPPDVRFPAFVIEGARLQSPSMSSRWQVTLTRWLGWTPWSMGSINANHPAAPYTARGSLPLMLALMLAGSALLLLALGLRGRHAWRVLGVTLMLAWLLLDMRWLSQMQRNHALSRALFEGQSWAQRSQIIADRPLQQRAALIDKVLARQQAGVHVLYWTPSQVDSVRLGYFLRPHNVASLPPGMDPDVIPDGTLLLIDNQDMSWRWDAQRNRLSRGSYVARGDLLWRQNDMLLLSVRQGAGT